MKTAKLEKITIDGVEYFVVYEGKTKYTKLGDNNYQPEYIDFKRSYYFYTKADAEAVVKTLLNHDITDRCESSSYEVKPIFLTEEEIKGKIVYKSKLDFYRQNLQFADLDPDAKKDKQVLNQKNEEIRDAIYRDFEVMPCEYSGWHFTHEEFIKAFKQIGIDFVKAFKCEAITKSQESYSFYFPSKSEVKKADSILTKSKKFVQVQYYPDDPLVCFKQEFELDHKKFYQNADEFLEANPEFKP